MLSLLTPTYVTANDKLYHILDYTASTNEYPAQFLLNKYGVMIEELVIRKIRIDEAGGRGDSNSRMTSFEVIMPLKLQSIMKTLL